MMALDARGYEPVDRLHLWWLQDPLRPAPIGQLHLVLNGRGVSLRYDEAWLAHGFALSEDLPLRPGEFMPERDRAVGAVDDARPDRWGERVIRFLERPRRLSILEYLLFAGQERFGALGVSVSSEAYLPAGSEAMPDLEDIDSIHEAVRLVEAGAPVSDTMRRLVAPGATMGGAKPKALVRMEGTPWVLKFSEYGESGDIALIEHATLTLAQQAGICVARSVPVALSDRRAARSPGHHALAVQRFDRVAGPDGHLLRRHALSADVALRAAGLELGYPELAQVLRRRADASRAAGQMAELFRRMVFNILFDNSDDHEKNHALLVADDGTYELSPAFDVLPAAQSLGYQQMRVGANGSESTLANAWSMADQFGLEPAQAMWHAAEVAACIDNWRQHFRAVGVQEDQIEALAQHVDRHGLLSQRQLALAS